VGGVRAGDNAPFGGKTFRTRQFEGTVRQVRQAPTTVQNVVTYDVVVDVDNRDGALKPGMTATTRIVKAERDDVLMLPAQALRFRPEGVAGDRAGGGQRRSDRAASGAATGAGDGTRHGRAWILRDGKPTAGPLVVGLEEGAAAEVAKGELAQGDQVIAAEATTAPKGPGAGQAPRFFQPGSR